MANEANRATHELVSPGDHWHNIAKISIQTYRNHFVGVLSGLHKSFPMHLWCQLLPQAEAQLNLLQQSFITPNILVYAHIHSPHNFMHKPLSPLRCPIFAHKNPDKRGSWADHAINAWICKRQWNTIRLSMCTENTQELKELATSYSSSTSISSPKLWHHKIRS